MGSASSLSGSSCCLPTSSGSACSDLLERRFSMSTQTAPQLPTFEPRWPAALAVLAAIGLYASLPSKLISDEHASGLIRFVVPAFELALLVPLAVTAPYRH